MIQSTNNFDKTNKMVPNSGSKLNTNGNLTRHQSPSTKRQISHFQQQLQSSDIELEAMFRTLRDWNTYLEKEVPSLKEQKLHLKPQEPQL